MGHTPNIPSDLEQKLRAWSDLLEAIAASFESEQRKLEAAVSTEREAYALLCKQASGLVGKSSHVAEEVRLICAHLICARSTKPPSD